MIPTPFIKDFSPRTEELLKLYPETFDKIKTNFAEPFDTVTEYFKSYKFWMAFYNKMFDENNIDVSFRDDYKFLSRISYFLKKEHLINWTRNKLYEVNNYYYLHLFIDKSLSEKFQTHLKIENFKIIRLFYLTEVCKFLIDDYMLTKIPELKQFIKIC